MNIVMEKIHYNQKYQYLTVDVSLVYIKNPLPKYKQKKRTPTKN